MDVTRFKDRRHAGRALAKALKRYAARKDVLVLGLPRGGVPVAYEVAKALRAPLDVFVVRKLGAPWHEELAMGAIASGGAVVLNGEVITTLAIPPAAIDDAVASEKKELERRERAYRGQRPRLDAAGKTIVVVDDGLATGSTMRAAIAGLRQLGPAAIVVAVPVASQATCDEIGAEVDEIVCVSKPALFFAVGTWYEDFAQTTDREVRELLASGSVRTARSADGGHSQSPTRS